MIDKKLFQNLSRKLGIRAERLERDYVMNLILDAFAHCPSTADTFFFKGGCCVHKCFSQHTFKKTEPIDDYFLNGRFSSDIDLTVTPEMMTEEKLNTAFKEVQEYLKARHGLVINQFSFPIHQNNKQQVDDKTKTNCRGIIHFEGPMFHPKFNSPRLKFDITADERVVFSPYKRLIYHPYSNEGEEMVLVAKTYTLRDIFAEKIRALYDRCSPRDVYDLVILRNHPDLDDYRQSGIGLSIMEKFMLKGMDYNITFEQLNRLGKNGIPLIEDCRKSWENALHRQVIKHPDFESYYQQLPEIVSFAVRCIEKAEKEMAKENRTSTFLGFIRNLPLNVLENISQSDTNKKAQTQAKYNQIKRQLKIEEKQSSNEFQKQINEAMARERRENTKC